MIKLIVGLNNPGAEYEATRHNAGKWVVDALLAAHNATLKPEKKFHGLVAEVTINNQRVRVLCPTTFMNKSGDAVQAMMNFYNLKPEEVLVIHDELALGKGVCKFKFGGGHAGHNGLRSIHAFAGDGYWRLRVGIDHPGDKTKVTGHVLSRLSGAARAEFDPAVDKCVRGVEDIFYYGLDKVMNTFNAG